MGAGGFWGGLQAPDRHFERRGRAKVNVGWPGLPLTHASHGHGELMDLFVQLGWQERRAVGGGDDRSACSPSHPREDAWAWLSCCQLTRQACILKPARCCGFLVFLTKYNLTIKKANP